VADLHLEVGMISDFPTTHDTFLHVAAVTGVPGLLIYLWLPCVPIVWSHKSLRRVGIVHILGLFVANLHFGQGPTTWSLGCSWGASWHWHQPRQRGLGDDIPARRSEQRGV